MGDECLFNGFVGVGLLLCQTLDLGWDVGERRVVGVSEVIVVEQSRVTLLNKLSVWASMSITLDEIKMDSRVKTDVIKLVDTLPVILNSGSGGSIAITVQQVAGGVGD